MEIMMCQKGEHVVIRRWDTMLALNLNICRNCQSWFKEGGEPGAINKKGLDPLKANWMDKFQTEVEGTVKVISDPLGAAAFYVQDKKGKRSLSNSTTLEKPNLRYNRGERDDEVADSDWERYTEEPLGIEILFTTPSSPFNRAQEGMVEVAVLEDSSSTVGLRFESKPLGEEMMPNQNESKVFVVGG
uniref:Uncharacterized protein n=1 Tax=Nelumbo nucifera TaxID=4432 RepID=A0A822YE15_NELNU|nr:TPA_asm: hypothetical protein HUJ06_029186 [Nelumbo nucifera]